MSALPFTYLYLLNGHVLYALGEQRAVSLRMVIVALLNGTLNALLIPRWGMQAAAWVALTSELTLFIALRLAAHRSLHDDRRVGMEALPS